MPSGIKNAGVNVAEFVYDFAVDGGAISTISLSAKAGYGSLPQNAYVKNVHARVITACVGTSTTVAFGNTTDPDGYLAATAEATLIADYISQGGTATSVLLWDDTNDHQTGFLVNSANDADFSITIATGALTAGKIAFYVEYYLHSVNA